MKKYAFFVRRPGCIPFALLAAMWGLGLVAATTPAAEPSADAGQEFFEKKIRPLLTQRCLQCHGAEKQQGKLRLDSREGWAKGGDSGPAIVPGKVDESLLIQAVRYVDYEMPPSGQLPREQIALLEQWVAMGAPDPRLRPPGSNSAPATDIGAGRQHWAYQPPVRHPVPAVKNSAWPRGEVDAFVLARLEAAQLSPVEDADRQTLVRRAYFDLVGLPPTPEQIDAFVNDPREDAFERLVDQLLDSPQFGERWGRHWLDVARFAESVTLRGFIFKEAWRFRDYVIDSFNRDVPYDRFVREQIAGDLMPADDWQQGQRQLIATTFLMLGNSNLEEQDKRQLDMDFVDEQLDTIGKALLAQTIGCARCHDHKFDPIPTRDYYALAGILHSGIALNHANVSAWNERRLPLSPEQEQTLRETEQAIASLSAQLKAAKERAAEVTATAIAAAPESPAVISPGDLPGLVVDSAQAKAVGQWINSQYSKRYIGDGYLHDDNADKGAKTLTFQAEFTKPGRYEVRLAYLASKSRAKNVPITILHADGETEVTLDQQKAPVVDGRFVTLGQFRFEVGNQGYVLVSNEGTQGHVVADAVQFLPLDVPIEKTGSDAAPAAGTVPQSTETKKLAADIQRMEQELKRLSVSAPPTAKVMALREGRAGDVNILLRGNVHTPGESAPRGFLQVATVGTPPAIPADESGRLQLAVWLASPANPLTARVMVNRVWYWLFGEGLVRSLDNFGTTGDAPTHPELLDELTLRFVEEGWSVKRLVRHLMLTRTYQLSSHPSAAGQAADPENRLRWRMTRRRLDAEAIRDSLLQISGELRPGAPGPTFPASLASDFGYKHAEPCRSVYVPVFRNSLPDLFEVFDFPDPSTVAGRRSQSTVAPQALFLMNHPLVIQQAQLTARRVLDEPLPDDASRVRQLYRLVLGRLPTTAEAQVSLKYVQSAGEQTEATASQSAAAWAQLVQALFASPDFRYLN